MHLLRVQALEDDCSNLLLDVAYCVNGGAIASGAFVARPTAAPSSDNDDTHVSSLAPLRLRDPIQTQAPAAGDRPDKGGEGAVRRRRRKRSRRGRPRCSGRRIGRRAGWMAWCELA